MANKHIGEVSLPVGGETYTMRMTIREMIRIEAHFDKSWNDCVMSMTDNMKIGDLLHWIKSALSNKHPELSDDDVCEIITQAGLSKVTAKLQEAIVASLPKSEAATGDAPPT
jgi:hypothetical protein